MGLRKKKDKRYSGSVHKTRECKLQGSVVQGITDPDHLYSGSAWPDVRHAQVCPQQYIVQSTYKHPHQEAQRPLWYAKEVLRKADKQVNMKEGKGNMRFNLLQPLPD